VGVDVGGTFTDVLVETAAGDVLAAYKVPSTPDDPSRAVLTGLAALPDKVRTAGYAIRHGTTVATNALLEGRGARTALITNRGFRDVLALRRQARPALFKLRQHISEPLCPRELRFGVAGRMASDGTEVELLDTAELHNLAERLREQDVEAVAVAFLHSYANPDHERRAADLIAAALPRIFVTTSSEVAPEIGEYERTSTAVVNAYVGPAVQGYISRLEDRIGAVGGASIGIIKSNGGATSPANASRFPVHLIESGPAAGVVAVAALARRLGLPRVIAFDLGGTTAKVAVIEDGRPAMTREFQADRYVDGQDVGGYPIRSATIDLIEIGAGGGSLAWLDSQGLIKIGPRSAGAVPGPACFGRGGTLPTLTDAHAALGNLSVAALSAAGVSLDPERGAAAIRERVADPLGWTVARAAHAIVDIANAKMADLVRLATVRRGLDPRDHVLLAYGGGGPLHAAAIADALGIREVIIPPAPGMFSAGGSLRSEIRHDVAITYLTRLADVSPATLQARFAEAESRLLALFGAEAETGGMSSIERSLEVRFAGQIFTQDVPVELPFDTARVEVAFRTGYTKTFGYELPDSTAEVVNLKVVARAVRTEEPIGGDSAPSDRTISSSDMTHVALARDGSLVAQPVITRADLRPGARQGPLTLADEGATVLLPTGWMLDTGNSGSLRAWTTA
jgi:N-methylhydantoinase A